MSVLTYEQRLNANTRWALQEGGMHFERNSEVFRSLEKVAQRLSELNIPYAVVGGMAMFLHGYRRFTEDVDLLVSRENLRRIHDELEGRGYLPPFAGSKQLRDAGNGVRIEFLVAGEYPGDGKPKPVVFPDPLKCHETIDGLECLPLDKLIELKLASSSAPGRRRDLGDAQELIRAKALPLEFGGRIDASVRPLFEQLWTELQIASPNDA